MPDGMAWHDSDPFWHAHQSTMFGPSRIEAAQGEVTQLLELTGLSRGRVLDLPCGVGRHTLELARRGFQVTGVDRTARYLERARQEAEGLELELVLGDMRAFRREASFDLALNLFSSFGYFEDEADDVRVLEGFRANLVPGGLLVLDTMATEILARVWSPQQVSELDDGTLIIERRELLDGWSRVRSTWTVIQDGRRADDSFEVRLYSAAHLRSLMTQAGFSEVRVFGGLDGSPYDLDARRLVLLARR
jgi:SAM-dependent methyltransferase